MKFPLSGAFESFLPHELFIDVIATRFSGSVELDYGGGARRSFRFESGRMCAASSSAEEEQLDSLIRAEREPQLTEEQRNMILQRVEGGGRYGKALVEAALMTASELLEFNRKQAAAILAGALRETPVAYRMDRGSASGYRPLPIDVHRIICKSILNDLDTAVVRRLLGEEETAYLAEKNLEGGSVGIRKDEEIRSILSHLDGQRTIREVSGKIGLNPQRTSRMLLFLKLLGWIEPAAAQPATRAREQDASDVPAGYGDIAAPEEEEDGADILRLLGDDESSVDVDTAIAGLPPLDDGDTVDIGGQTGNSIDEQTEPETGEEDAFSGYLAGGARTSRSGSLLRYIIPAAVGLTVIIVVSLALLNNGKTGQGGADNQLSFYPPEVEKEQLPLDKDFNETKESTVKPLRVDVPSEDKQSGGEDKTDAGNESQPASPEENPVKDNEKPTTADDTSAQPVSDNHAEEETNRNDRQDAANPPLSLDEAQPLALDRGFRGDWLAAAEIWSTPLAALDRNAYTILVSTTRDGARVSSIFERFANSASMRNQFFVIHRESIGYHVCWGFFPSKAAADNALRALPDRVRQFSPALRQLGDLLP